MAGEEIQPGWLAQSSEMRLHGACFIGAGVAWSCIAMFAQQSPVFVPPIQVGAMNSARGIA